MFPRKIFEIFQKFQSKLEALEFCLLPKVAPAYKNFSPYFLLCTQLPAKPAQEIPVHLQAYAYVVGDWAFSHGGGGSIFEQRAKAIFMNELFYLVPNVWPLFPVLTSTSSDTNWSPIIQFSHYLPTVNTTCSWAQSHKTTLTSH